MRAVHISCPTVLYFSDKRDNHKRNWEHTSVLSISESVETTMNKRQEDRQGRSGLSGFEGEGRRRRKRKEKRSPRNGNIGTRQVVNNVMKWKHEDTTQKEKKGKSLRALSLLVLRRRKKDTIWEKWNHFILNPKNKEREKEGKRQLFLYLQTTKRQHSSLLKLSNAHTSYLLRRRRDITFSSLLVEWCVIYISLAQLAERGKEREK